MLSASKLPKNDEYSTRCWHSAVEAQTNPIGWNRQKDNVCAKTKASLDALTITDSDIRSVFCVGVTAQRTLENPIPIPDRYIKDSCIVHNNNYVTLSHKRGLK